MTRLTTKGPSRLRVLAIGFMLCVPGLAAAAHAQLTDRIIVKYRSPAAGELARQVQQRSAGVAAQRLGLRMTHLRTTALGSQVLQLDRRLPLEQARRLAADIAAGDPGVEYAEPDGLNQHTLSPVDPLYPRQWHYYESAGGINAPAAWDKATGAGVVVAVLDTGFQPHGDLGWPPLQGFGNLLPGYDFISDVIVANDGDGRDLDARDPGDWIEPSECEDAEPRGSSWTGMHVAGIIAARTNIPFVTGGAGVAFDARILPARVLGKCGGYDSDIADAIVWSSGGDVNGVPANVTPAQVINLSLGHEAECNATWQNAIDVARARGTVVVAAAGNGKIDAAGFVPANCNGVITVAATNRSGGRANYSNFGATVELAAPGGGGGFVEDGVLSTVNSGRTVPVADSYAYYEGTSVAAPHVSGVVALMLSVNPFLTPDEVTAILQRTARRFPAPCVGCGSGIVDANLAVEAALGNTCLYQDQEIVAIQDGVWHGVDLPTGLRTSLPCVDWSGAEAMAFTDGKIYAVQGGELWKTNVGDGATSSLGGGWSGSEAMAAVGGNVYTVRGNTLWRTVGSNGTTLPLARNWTGTEAMAAGRAWTSTTLPPSRVMQFRPLVFAVRDGVIWKVDGLTGLLGLVSSGWNGTEAMTFGDGFLYLVWSDQLWKVDATSGVRTLVEAWGWAGTESMTYRDGFIYAVQGGQLWKTSPSGGSTALGSGWSGTGLMIAVQ